MQQKQRNFSKQFLFSLYCAVLSVVACGARRFVFSNDMSINRLWWEENYLVLFLGAGFELLGRGVAGLATVGLDTGQKLALPNRLQIQSTVVVLAENVREPYYLSLPLFFTILMFLLHIFASGRYKANLAPSNFY